MRNTSTGPNWLHWRFVFGTFAFWFLLFWLQFELVRPGGDEVAVGEHLDELLSYGGFLTLETAFCFRLSQWLLSRPRPRWTYATVLASTFAGFTTVHTVVFLWIIVGASGISASTIAFQFITTSLPHVAVLGAAVATNAFVVSERRQREVVDAQLRVLRGQLQPHFLFNTLQSISATVTQDGDAARRMIALLGDLLRQTLNEREGGLITLAEERGLLDPYVSLQQMRFGDRLRVEYDLTDETLGAAVPDLLLQPLVENAIQHSVERDPGPAVIRIRARRRDASLELEVVDDGGGPAPGAIVDGVGLGATRSRLQALFGAAADLRIDRGEPSGAVVSITIPWQEARLVA